MLSWKLTQDQNLADAKSISVPNVESLVMILVGVMRPVYVVVSDIATIPASSVNRDISHLFQLNRKL